MNASFARALSVADRRNLPVELGIVTAAVLLAFCIAMPGLILAVLLGMAVLVLSALRVNALLYLAIFLLPVAPAIPTSVMILREGSALLHIGMFVGVSLGYVIRGESILTWLFGNRLNQIIVAYCGLAVITVLLPGHTTISAERSLFHWVSYVCLYFAVSGWAKTERQIVNVLWVLGVSTLIVLIFGILQLIIDDYGSAYFWLYPKQEENLEPWTGRVTSFLGHFNSLAGYLNLILPLVIGFSAMVAHRAWKFLGWLYLVVGVIVVILTQSRGGLMGFTGIAFVAISCLSWKKGTRLRLTIVALICSALTFLALTAFSERFSEVDEWTALQRLAVYRDAVIMFVSSPILGVGYGNFRERYDPILIGAESGLLDAHNLYLKSLAETGLVGFLMLLATFGVICRTALFRFRFRQCSLDGILGFGILAGLCGILVHGLVDNFFEVSPQFGALFWTLVGLLMANERLRRPSRVFGVSVLAGDVSVR